MNKDNKKIMFLIISVIVIILVIILLIVFLMISYQNKTKHILSSLGIDDYFKYIFVNNYEKNNNLLDINNEEYMFMYYFYNKNTKIYKIDFKDPTFEGNLYLTYAKYNDYMDYHKKVFGVDSKHEMSLYDISIKNLVDVGNDIYNIHSTPKQCQKVDSTDNCYIKLTKDTGISGDVVLSKLNREDNVITGMASFNSKSEYFEFVFEENNGEYIIKSLKIVDNIE